MLWANVSINRHIVIHVASSLLWCPTVLEQGGSVASGLCLLPVSWSVIALQGIKEQLDGERDLFQTRRTCSLFSLSLSLLGFYMLFQWGVSMVSRSALQSGPQLYESVISERLFYGKQLKHRHVVLSVVSVDQLLRLWLLSCSYLGAFVPSRRSESRL